MFEFSSPFRVEIPAPIRAWADEWASINVDIAQESLIVSSGHRMAGMPPISLYGGNTPIDTHVDLRPEEIDDENPAHPIWGVILACPEGRLVWEDGATPIGVGSVYIVDPTRPHAVDAPPGAIAFAGTFSYDPRERFITLERFAAHVVEMVSQMHQRQPDPVRFIEIEAGLEPGELG